MEKYNKNSKCVKCGNVNALTRYTECLISFNKDIDEKDCGKEALKRQCRECGYQWYEKCIDHDNLIKHNSIL